MYYNRYDPERPRWRGPVAAVLMIALVGTIGVWLLNSGSGSGDLATAPSTSLSAPDATTNEAHERTPTASAVDTSSAASTTIDTIDSSNSGATATEVASLPVVPEEPALDYPTSPDGTPLPIVVIFDTETVTIAGQVPSQAAKDRLGALAIANSQFPDVELIDNMIINPAVPISIGTRVIELNSARFPEGSAEILPEHALELDRVVTIMEALPNISVLVIGHADQRGDDLTNFAVSDERARAVVNYLLYLGISPTRLASRAAGETDLLTIEDDDTALALNRRTEFVFYGLLVE